MNETQQKEEKKKRQSDDIEENKTKSRVKIIDLIFAFTMTKKISITLICISYEFKQISLPIVRLWDDG